MKNVVLVCLVLLSNLAFSQTDEQLEAAKNSDAGFPYYSKPTKEEKIWAAGHLFNHNHPVRINPDSTLRFQPNSTTYPDGRIAKTITMWIKNSEAKSQADEFVKIEAELPDGVRYDWKKAFFNPQDGYSVASVKGTYTLVNPMKQVRFTVVKKTICLNKLEMQRGETSTPKLETRWLVYTKALYDM